MHGQNALRRHEIIHQRENSLFHLASIFSPQNDDFTLAETQIDTRFGGHSRRVSASGKSASVEDDAIRFTE